VSSNTCWDSSGCVSASWGEATTEVEVYLEKLASGRRTRCCWLEPKILSYISRCFSISSRWLCANLSFSSLNSFTRCAEAASCSNHLQRKLIRKYNKTNIHRFASSGIPPLPFANRFPHLGVHLEGFHRRDRDLLLRSALLCTHRVQVPGLQVGEGYLGHFGIECATEVLE